MKIMFINPLVEEHQKSINNMLITITNQQRIIDNQLQLNRELMGTVNSTLRRVAALEEMVRVLQVRSYGLAARQDGGDPQ